MKLSKIQKDTLSHYDRMIKYAKTQNHIDIPLISTMYLAIGESWDGNSCKYCIKHCSDCWSCSLADTKSESCCEEWGILNLSTSWEEWIINAEAMKKHIIKKG